MKLVGLGIGLAIVVLILSIVLMVTGHISVIIGCMFGALAIARLS